MVPPHEAFAQVSAVRLLERLGIAGKWIPACAGMTSSKLLQVQPNRAAVVAQKIVAPTGWSWDGPDEEVAKALLTDQPERAQRIAQLILGVVDDG
jgi:hypothetical protein